MKRTATGVLLTLMTALTIVAPTFAQTSSAFQRVWDRQDRAVAEKLSSRSWTWGPGPISEPVSEALVEGVEGRRLVQYYDKSRMEINDPTADPNASWYVTNGLLPIELMTGRVQVGFNQYELRAPAAVSAIGDPNQFPTYADLLQLYQSPGAVNPGDLGKPATGFLNPDRSISGFNDYASDPATVLVRGENNHGVAKAFIDFQNQYGLVYDGGRYRQDRVYDPLFVFGLPVTGAFWVKVKVGGKEIPILFQVFERRVLTYNPANPPAFRVEMGNVGQHYYKWRYNK
ncbi:MAG: hypothetical protein OHK0022_16040 [Roseiflexaceae bacterium]